MRPKKTILSVDDREHSNSLRTFMLETRGYRVLLAHNGREALELFRDHPVDLVLSDLMMPDMNGAELVRQLKSDPTDTPATLFRGQIRSYQEGTHADRLLPHAHLGLTDGGALRVAEATAGKGVKPLI